MAIMGDIQILHPRRKAKAAVHTTFARKLDLPTTEEYGFSEYDCFVLLATHEADDDESTPVFVCEFMNGRVGNVYTELVRFVEDVGCTQ